jgi:hypothetical protein
VNSSTFKDDDFLHDVHQAVAHVVAVDDFVAEAVDDLALLVHHVVVFERAFALLEIVLLDALLRLLDGTVQQRCSVPGLPPGPFSPSFHDAVGTEQPHQIVLQRNEKVRRAGVALARAAAAQLAVNAPRFVAFGAEHVQAADLRDAGAEFDVRAAAGHVGGDGDGAALARRARRFPPPAGDIWR